ncbi:MULTISPECIES: isochorismate synthase [Cyanophyceae]|uniref:isochorismate synthase n=1 Tax=Cyanophyceae TaxID=3028117 RepID=UPI001689B3C5|nr:isochorismate synthase [Trichocoleus sp. FACHB-69]MBD1935689.1 isochorismate synthase [Trichocoleus sp. FACHB-69]
MTLTPLRSNLFQDSKELYQFLLKFKQTSLPKKQTKILSISQEIPDVDPLAVLQAIGLPEQLHFYFEKPGQGEAIAAIDSVTSLKLESPDRFYQSQQFIQSCLANTTSIGAINLPFYGPHFFCSFTFFNNNLEPDSPFPSATIFLPRWQIAFRKNISVVVANIAINSEINLQDLSESLWRTFHSIKMAGVERLNSANLLNIAIDARNKFIKQNVTDVTHFKSSVIKALSSIESKKIDKIVLAHAFDVISPIPFQLIPSLNHLRIRHPDCYIFSTSNGNGQNFIGASPERLISIHNHKLVTDALAGSAARGKTTDEDAELANRLLTSEKERREHRVVIDFITQRLSQLGLHPEILSQPKLLQLLNIQHLWTPIQAQLPADVNPLEIVAQLHPTPAVAGAPTEIAQEEIRHYETFNRSLYAAPLGWINSRGDSEFIVGIRSALIDDCRARLYAGAGIVAGSEPEKELAEIQLKLQALLKALV